MKLGARQRWLVLIALLTLALTAAAWVRDGDKSTNGDVVEAPARTTRAVAAAPAQPAPASSRTWPSEARNDRLQNRTGLDPRLGRVRDAGHDVPHRKAVDRSRPLRRRTAGRQYGCQGQSAKYRIPRLLCAQPRQLYRATADLRRQAALAGQARGCRAVLYARVGARYRQHARTGGAGGSKEGVAPSYHRGRGTNTARSRRPGRRASALAPGARGKSATT